MLLSPLQAASKLGFSRTDHHCKENKARTKKEGAKERQKSFTSGQNSYFNSFCLCSPALHSLFNSLLRNSLLSDTRHHAKAPLPHLPSPCNCWFVLLLNNQYIIWIPIWSTLQVFKQPLIIKSKNLIGTCLVDSNYIRGRHTLGRYFKHQLTLKWKKY